LILVKQIAELNEIISGPRNEYIDKWKDDGKQVVGYFCSYVPVELLSAAGILPVRLRGAGSTDSGSADVFMSSRTCTYVRHVMTLVLKGRYDFLDGEICLNTCDHVRRCFDLFRHKTSVGFHEFISVPRNVRESLYPYFREEIENIKSAIESYFSVEINDQALKAAISVHNKVRRRLARIDQFRAAQKPILTGADLLIITVASQLMPAADFIDRAELILAALESEQPGIEEPRARIMLSGGEMDDPGFVQAVESHGGVVVADSLCTGMRACQGLVDEDAADYIDALSRRYFFQVHCARMIGNFPDRVADMLNTIEDRKIDGVVFQRLKFCDPWGGEAHNLRHRLKKHDIPLLVLEREYGLVNSGQVKTRIQAFMEMIESKTRRASKNAKVQQSEENPHAR